MIDQFKTKEIISKWSWMMDYCRSNFLPPADRLSWEEAEKAYEEFIKTSEAPE